jgi:hypothetical protein
MFYHSLVAKEEAYESQGIVYEILVYRALEDGRLSGHISSGLFSDLIAEMSGESAKDIERTGHESSIEFLVKAMKVEIDSGRYISAIVQSRELQAP